MLGSAGVSASWRGGKDGPSYWWHGHDLLLSRASWSPGTIQGENGVQKSLRRSSTCSPPSSLRPRGLRLLCTPGAGRSGGSQRPILMNPSGSLQSPRPDSDPQERTGPKTHLCPGQGLSLTCTTPSSRQVRSRALDLLLACRGL